MSDAPEPKAHRPFGAGTLGRATTEEPVDKRSATPKL